MLAQPGETQPRTDDLPCPMARRLPRQDSSLSAQRARPLSSADAAHAAIAAGGPLQRFPSNASHQNQNQTPPEKQQRGSPSAFTQPSSSLPHGRCGRALRHTSPPGTVLMSRHGTNSLGKEAMWIWARGSVAGRRHRQPCSDASLLAGKCVREAQTHKRERREEIVT